MFQKHLAFNLTFLRSESLCRFGPHVKTLNSWVRTWKFLSHIKNIPLLPAVDAEAEEWKWCQAQWKPRASYTGKSPTHSWANRFHLEKLCGTLCLPQRKDTTIHCFWQGSDSLFLHQASSLVASYYNPLATVPSSSTKPEGAAALLGSAEQCSLAPVQGSGSHWRPGGIQKAAVNLKIYEHGKLPPTAPLQKATMCTNIILTILL